MTNPYEFSRRVREYADGCGPTVGKRLRDLANEYDTRIARYEAEIAVLRAEVERLSQPPPEIIKAQRTRPHPNPWVDKGSATSSGGAG